MILVELDHAKVVFTTRLGGVSQAPFDSLNVGVFTEDKYDFVAQNLNIIQLELGLRALHMVHQVHGAEVHEVQEGRLLGMVDGDGLISSVREEGLLVAGADCIPLALATPTQVAMLHCGWRGIAAGIVERALDRLDDGPVQAAIGPGISFEHFEVGLEVPEQIGADALGAFRDGHLDLPAVLITKLQKFGVERIEHVDRCTYGEPGEFFSHRRDGAPTGRQAGLVWRA